LSKFPAKINLIIRMRARSVQSHLLQLYWLSSNKECSRPISIVYFNSDEDYKVS